MEKWRDPEANRDVWLAELASPDDFPASVPWTCAHFAMLVLADRVADVEPLARAALARGIAIASAWGPAAAVMEDALGEVITSRDAIVTSHGYESIEEALESFLAIEPPAARRGTCRAWCVVALGPELARAARRALERRGFARATITERGATRS